jgi:hypothetical protein
MRKPSDWLHIDLLWKWPQKNYVSQIRKLSCLCSVWGPLRGWPVPVATAQLKSARRVPRRRSFALSNRKSTREERRYSFIEHRVTLRASISAHRNLSRWIASFHISLICYSRHPSAFSVMRKCCWCCMRPCCSCVVHFYLISSSPSS